MKFKYIFLLPVFLLAAFVSGEAQNGQFKLPEYEKYQLPNGLTVYLMEQHEVPLVYLSYVNQGGAVRDGQKFGLASLVADGLMFGAGDMSRNDIEAAFDAEGAELSTFAGTEASLVNASFHQEDTKEFFNIISMLLTKPNFDQEEFEAERARRLARLEQAKESPRQVIGDYFDRYLYGNHPYGNPVYGTLPSVKSITREDLVKFFNENYHPEVSALALVGDFETAEMKTMIDRFFGSWNPAGKAQKSQVSEPQLSFSKPGVLLVDKADSRETTFFIGGKGVARDNSDYVGIQVINTILGGRFTSWLNDELRVNSGLTYGARSRFSMNRKSGTFLVTSFTKNSTTVEAIDLALKVLDRLHTEGVDEATLSSAKNYIKGNFPPRFETSGDLAGLLTDMYIYGYNESFINDFQKNVDNVTVNSAKQIIKKYFPSTNFQFVLVGKADEIEEQVKKYGKVTKKDIKAEGF